MARADRLERLDRKRCDLEADYIAALVDALEQTAAGSWGLFDHQQDRSARARVAPVIATLAELAEDIDEARNGLSMEPFTLHAQFLAERGKPEPNAVGEPKQARAFLARLRG
jgi:sugar phosphate isomerase/epimerase